jgi:hypothetical protein
MRTAAIIAIALIASAVPALAQDRTPPAGSIRALEAPIDARPSQFNNYSYGRAPFEGRSAYDNAAPDARYQRDDR